MLRGTVKWFNNAKGYGFILADESGGDIFAHYSSIEMDGYKTLKAGQVVNFELVNGDKGMHAAHIQAEDMPTGDQTVAPGQLEPVIAAENYNH